MIKIICVGKIKEDYLKDMIEDYSKRIIKYHKLEIIEIPDNNINDEGKNILSKMNIGYNVSLSIDGLKRTSEEFAQFIDKTLMYQANINFIIGGSEGILKEVLDKCDMHLSFGNMTYPHGMFRGILLEQIYRAFKILNNESYHK